MEVRPGYKQTEVGVIPEDWEANQLGRLAEFITSGSRGWAAYYSEHGALFIRSQNVRAGRLDFEDTQLVSPPPGAEGNRTQVNPDDLLITITGNSVGNLALAERDLGEAYVSQHVGLVRLSQPKLCDYVCRFLSPGSAGNRQIWASQSGQSKPGLTLRNLQNFWVALPSTECERRAIEKALSNVDGLLTGLDRLIMKKRDLKRAAMQQLLTGQTRLPSFRRGWKPKKLAELLQYQRPDEFVVKSDNYFEKGETAVLTANKSFILGYTNEKFGVYDNPPAIIFDDFTCDSKYVDFDFKVKSSAVKILTPRNVDASLRFIYEQMRLIRFRIGEHKRYYISEYQHIDLLIPEFEEQIAIAEVLRDMDAEIAALEQRREKTHLLKQAMMQELLTGKTRLI